MLLVEDHAASRLAFAEFLKTEAYQRNEAPLAKLGERTGPIVNKYSKKDWSRHKDYPDWTSSVTCLVVRCLKHPEFIYR